MLYQRMKRVMKMNKILTGLGVSALSVPAFAAYDTTAVTTGVADAATAVAAIGAAVVLVVLGIKVFKWIARSL